MTDDGTVALVPVPFPRPRVARYDDDTIETAYQAWAYQYGQDAKATSRALELDHSTVARWSRDRAWIERLARDVQASGPMDYASSMYSLRLAARHGAAYILRVVTAEERGDKLRLLAALSALDRVGIAPILKREQSVDDIDRAAFGFAPDAKLTFDQAKALTAEERDKRRFG